MLRVNAKQLGNIAVFWVQGKIVRGDTDALRSAVLARSDVSAVVLDLARVNTIDAGGLGVLLELREHAESGGIEFRLINVTKLVGRVLEITRLDTVFAVAAQTHVSQQIPLVRSPCWGELAACA